MIAFFLDQTNQQNDADRSNHVQFVVRQQQRQKRSHARRRQSRQNRDGMNVAFVEHAEHDVNRD